MVGLFSHPKRKLRKLIKEGEFEEAIAMGNSMEENFKENAKVIECCKKILEVDSDAYDVRAILNELEGK